MNDVVRAGNFFGRLLEEIGPQAFEDAFSILRCADQDRRKAETICRAATGMIAQKLGRGSAAAFEAGRFMLAGKLFWVRCALQIRCWLAVMALRRNGQEPSEELLEALRKAGRLLELGNRDSDIGA